MPHFQCTVCRRPRPKPMKAKGLDHEEFGWVCARCLRNYTFEALRVIASFKTCSNCSVSGTSLDGDYFGDDWYCDLCTYELHGPSAGKE